MRRLRVRVTVKTMMVLVAVVALGLAIAAEFRDGSPPRFVVRGIPRRIARLRPGMTPEETHAILGVDQTWLTGGTGALFGGGHGGLSQWLEFYDVRPPRIVVRTVQFRGSPPRPTNVLEKTVTIQLRFHDDYASGTKRLVSASFCSGTKTIAEMSRSP
jgi:hypothetical protein